jgi:CHAT domain-containing protein
VAGKKLSDLLLSDVLEILPLQAHLIIIPHDLLGMLPFDALVLNDKGSVKTDKALPYISGADFFGDRNPTSYYESITTLALAKNKAVPVGNKSRVIVIADPIYSEKDARLASPNKKSPKGKFPLLPMELMGAADASQDAGPVFPRLTLTGDLGKALSELYHNGCAVYTGQEASKSNFLKNIAPDVREDDKIVFATHCYFGNEIPGVREPALVLTLVPKGTDGYLRMTEVMGLNLNTDTVVLMGSATGLGERIPVEGNMSMGRAFRYAGAKSVLMSLWSVAEVASVKLVKSFFEHIKAGKSKPEALELARSELRKGVFDHPFFWAGFILVGETN